MRKLFKSKQSKSSMKIMILSYEKICSKIRDYFRKLDDYDQNYLQAYKEPFFQLRTDEIRFDEVEYFDKLSKEYNYLFKLYKMHTENVIKTKVLKY